MIILFDTIHLKLNTIILRETTLKILNNKIPNVESKQPVDSRNFVYLCFISY